MIVRSEDEEELASSQNEWMVTSLGACLVSNLKDELETIA